MANLVQWCKVLQGITEEGRLYWLKVLVDQGKLSKSEAGYVITHGLITVMVIYGHE